MKIIKTFISVFSKRYFILLLLLSPFVNVCLAQDEEKEAVIKLSFDQNDSERICKAVVTSDGMPVKETEVHFYVKRMYSLLPIEKAVETDTAGEATMLFPLDLPGDKNGNLIVVAKIEDDDNFGTVDVEAPVKWGAAQMGEKEEWGMRSLSASRDKAPMVLIIVSNTIIAIIWGTLIFVIYQIVRIRKASHLVKTKKIKTT